jgi:hypothetical protein
VRHSQSPVKSRRIVLAGAILIASITALAPAASGITVNSTGDGALFVSREERRTCETGPGNGDCTLRAAIQLANLTGGADTIIFRFPAGTTNCTAEGFCTINVASQLPDISDGLSISGPGPDKLDIIRVGSTQFRIFNITTTSAVSISGLRISRGQVGASGAGIQNQNAAPVTVTNCVFEGNHGHNGGGFANSSTGTVTLTNCTFRDNTASASGGAVANMSTGSIAVSNCTFNANATPPSGGGGGAVSNFSTGTISLSGITCTANFAGNGGGCISSSGVLTVTDSNLTANRAVGRGGALDSSGDATIIGSTFAGNSLLHVGFFSPPLFGGAISHRGGRMTVSKSAVVDNSCVRAPQNVPARGGGIWSAADLTISDSIIEGNGVFGGSSGTDVPAPGDGGGIYSTGPLTLSSCTVAGNFVNGIDGNANHPPAPTSGGGIYSSGGLAVTNSSIFGNSARGGANASSAPPPPTRGGGIYSAAAAKVTNSTVANNAAIGGAAFQSPGARPGEGSAGGIYRAGGNFEVKSTLVANNSASTTSPDAAGQFISFGYNLIGKVDVSGGFIATTDRAGTMSSPLDAKLDPDGLKNNGGLTRTVALLLGSPAIDGGTSAGLTGSLTVDQRGSGFARVVDYPNVPNAAGGDGTDIGAFELQPMATPTPSPTATPAPTATPTPTRLANISTRMRVETGDNVLIGGFIITGTAPKRLIVRAGGPSLPLQGTLANPLLELFDREGQLIASNDNWGEAPNRQEIIDSGIAPQNDLEAAILRNLEVGAYTAVVRDVADGQGVGLVEVYDLGNDQDSKLANISTRGRVLTGDHVMIGGLIVTGSSPQKVILRASGPSLGIAGQLEDPSLELFDGSGNPIVSNDNWKETQQQEIEATKIPPSNDLESAIVATLPPAAYTAVVRGVNDSTGVALIEVYALQ